MKRSLLALAALVSWTAVATAAKAVTGAVVTVAPLPVAPLIETLERATARVSWQGETIVPRRTKSISAEIEAAISDLRRSYLEADFLGCLRRVGQPKLGVRRLLERGARTEAARVELWGAACAHGAGDLDRARNQIRTALKRELPVDVGLSETRPDFQELVEAGRAALQRAGRVLVVVRTRPAGATLLVDGQLRCRQTPCTVRLFPAEHLLTATRPGYARRTARRRLERGTTVSLSLDAASPEEARRQLHGLLARGDRSSLDIGRLAATALSVQVVVIAWRDADKGHAALFDRRDDKVHARVSIKGGVDRVKRAVRSAVQEWLHARPKPFYQRAWFYVAVAGTVGLTALVTFLATRGGETRHDIVFAPR